MQPIIPVRITATAVSEGSAPNASLIPMATAAVTDFGIRDSKIGCGKLRASPNKITDVIAVTEPTTKATSIGSRAESTTLRFS
jgi:hypothetical protein